jgi:hypothetical protein
MALWSNQPLTHMNTRNISWGYMRLVRKADNLQPSCAVVTKSGNLNFLEPSGSVQVSNGTALPLPVPAELYLCQNGYVPYTIGSQYREIMWLEKETCHSSCSLYLWKWSYFVDGVAFLQTAVALYRPRSHGLDIPSALGSLLFNQTV